MIWFNVEISSARKMKKNIKNRVSLPFYLCEDQLTLKRYESLFERKLNPMNRSYVRFRQLRNS